MTGSAVSSPIAMQDNRITRIGGVEHLVNLQVFFLGGNRIADFKDMQKLVHLPVLRALSLDDAHFGACPVCAIDGYREFVIATLKQASLALVPRRAGLMQVNACAPRRWRRCKSWTAKWQPRQCARRPQTCS